MSEAYIYIYIYVCVCVCVCVELVTVPYVNNGPVIYIGKIMNFKKFCKRSM